MFVIGKHQQGAFGMKKIILAISGIFCLQLGFIGFNLGDPAAEQSFVRRDDEAAEVLTASAIETPFEDSVVPAEFDDSILDDEVVQDLDTDVSVRSVRSEATTERSVVRRARKPMRNTFVENANAIRPVRIQYKTYDAVAFRPQTAPRVMRTEYPQVTAPSYEQRQFETSARIAPKKKKGFFAKSLNVIKKPYDWLKAVGSAIK
jgi:hypothetical protein